MVTDDLINYIKSSLASGIDSQAIKAELRSHGWANDDIDSAFISAQSGMGSALPQETQVPSSGWHVTRKEIFITIASILILGAAGIAAAYFVVPPKPEKVVKAAASNLLNIKSFDYSGNLIVDLSAPSGFFSLDTIKHGIPKPTDERIAGTTETKFDIDFNGTADITDEKNPKSDLNLNFSYSLFSFALEMRLLDKIYYLKFNNLPKVPEYNINQYSNTWIKIDPKDISKEYGVDIDTTTKQSELTDGQKQQIIDLASKAHIFNSITKLPDDKIDNEGMYHYAVDLDMAGIKDYFHEVERIQNSTKTTDTDLNGISISNVEVWIGKSDKYVHKLMAKITEAPDPGTTNIPASGSAAISLNLKNYNHPSLILAPESPKNILDVVKEFTTAAESKQY